MPTSDVPKIPYLVNAVGHFRPQSILDIGCGCGKYGLLFREYCDINRIPGPGCMKKENWRVRIDGVEGFPEYIRDLHRKIYDNVYAGDMLKVAPGLDPYDVICIAEVIEHLEKPAGKELLRLLYEKARKGVVISTPAEFGEQDALHDNPFERHLSVWDEGDLTEFLRKVCAVINETFVGVIAKPPAEPPQWLRPPGLKRRLRFAANALLRVFVPSHPEPKRIPDWPVPPAE